MNISQLFQKNQTPNQNIDQNLGDSKNYYKAGPGDILEWYQECMACLNKITPPSEEKNRMSLFLLERKNSNFSILMYSHVATLFKKLNKVIQSDVIERISTVPTEVNLFNTDYAQMTLTKDDKLTAIFNKKMLEDDVGLLKGFKSPMDRFKFVFLHEGAHGYLWDEYLKVEKGRDFFENSKNPINLMNFILVKERMEKGIEIYQKTVDNFSKNNNQLGAPLIFTFVEFNQMQKTLFQEMFCDSFPLLVNAQDEKLETPLEDLIELVAYNRRREGLGSSWIFCPTNSRAPDTQEHETSLALQRLSIVIKERNIDVKALTLDDIKELCIEVTTYGITHFMFEASVANPDYKVFLDCIDIEKPSQMSLLSDDESKEKNTDILFSALTQSDKTNSELKMKKMAEIAEIFKLKKYDDLISDDSVNQAHLEACKKTLEDKSNKKKLSSQYLCFCVANYYMGLTHQLMKKPKMIACQELEAALQGKKAKPIDPIEIPVESPQRSLIEKIKFNRSTPLENATHAIKSSALNAVNKVVLVPPVKMTPKF